MKMHNCSAFTLTEIIVASTVASIVMLGIITTNINLQKTSMDSSNSFYIKQSTINTYNHLMTSAALAVGSPAVAGILIGSNWSGTWNIAGGVGAKSLCFRQNVNPVGGNPWPGTADPTGVQNRWSCYTYLPTTWVGAGADTRIPGTIYWCTMPYTAVVPFHGATDCVFGSTNSTVVGTASKVVASLTPSSALFYGEVTNCMTNTTTLGTAPTSTLNNTCVTKTGNAYPPLYTAG